MKFAYKIFRTGGDVLLAIADSSVVGKTFEGDGLQLEVSKSFYSDKSCDEDEALRLAGEATIVNAVGKAIIALLAKNKIVHEDNVINIAGVPHAQVVVVR